MSQQLRVFAVLPEVQSPVPSTHVRGLRSSSSRDMTPPSGGLGHLHTYGIHIEYIFRN